MKTVRKIIEIDEQLCDGCGQCVPDCAEGALEVVDGKARMIAEKYCDGLGACLGSCPSDALRIIERKADEFDEIAVEELLKVKRQKDKVVPMAPSFQSCPSARIFNFPATPLGAALGAATKKPVSDKRSAATASALSHWPVQIRLVPPTAPFLKNADLLVAADCTPLAYPTFHRDFLPGKAVMLGCPKFDDVAGYIEKFAHIFKVSGLRSITVAIMEVPCCAAMDSIIKEALKKSNRQIPTEKIVIGLRGDIQSRECQ